ncbi:hypothetical protein BJX99DRAFT_262508 [Aspergillus californicus]
MRWPSILWLSLLGYPGPGRISLHYIAPKSLPSYQAKSYSQTPSPTPRYEAPVIVRKLSDLPGSMFVIRSDGHSSAGVAASADIDITIDLQRLDGVRLDGSTVSVDSGIPMERRV